MYGIDIQIAHTVSVLLAFAASYCYMVLRVEVVLVL